MQSGDEDFAGYEPPSGDQLGNEHSQEPPAVNDVGGDGDEDEDTLP